MGRQQQYVAGEQDHLIVPALTTGQPREGRAPWYDASQRLRRPKPRPVLEPPQKDCEGTVVVRVALRMRARRAASALHNEGQTCGIGFNEVFGSQNVAVVIHQYESHIRTDPTCRLKAARHDLHL